MKQPIYAIFLLVLVSLASNLNSVAQCTATVAAAATVERTTYAIRTAQTFTPTCTGRLTGMNFTFANNYSDDFRGSGYGLRCNLKSAGGILIATGIWPNGKDLTDAAYPGATLTSTFECSNIVLIQNTQYMWEIQEIEYATQLSNYPVILFAYSATSVYAGGTYLVDGAARTAQDVQGWTVNMSNGSIATSTSTVTQNIGTCSGFYNTSSAMICAVKPGAVNGISGSTTVKLWVETNQPAQYVKRHYEIAPAANANTATGTVTLYFTQAEFDAFNTVSAVKLPANSTDAAGIANLRIEKRPGTSSNGSGLPGTYTGTPATINPADAGIVWNSPLARWEVTFDVTGFSGFFVKTITGVLPVKWLSVEGTISNHVAIVSWQVEELNVDRYDLERSSDGVSYKNIGVVSSKGDGKNSYAFTDPATSSDYSFYRIRQTDKDGKSSYSSVLKIDNTTLSAIQVYPTVFSDHFTIVVANDQVARVVDLQGKTALKLDLKKGSNKISPENLSSGIYLLTTSNGKTIKLIKR